MFKLRTYRKSHFILLHIQFTGYNSGVHMYMRICTYHGSSMIRTTHGLARVCACVARGCLSPLYTYMHVQYVPVHNLIAHSYVLNEQQSRFRATHVAIIQYDAG